MGLFSNFLRGSEENKNSVEMQWILLTEKSQIEEIILKSATKPVLIFKHSTRCGVSRMALKNFERDYDIEKTALELYFLDILKYRELSNEVSKSLAVHHQSPQILLINNKSVIYHDSHYQISVETVKEALLK
ncbi:bacillithiol system redox-active protein YtxJ [Lutibacter sp.]